ncbi:MAG: hypothetical protein WD844_10175 [Thermoleophilaceae bacterium]
MRNRTITLLVAALAAASLLAACGGDDDDGDGGEQALSKAEYIEQGDAICAEGDREIEQAAEETFSDLEQGEQPSVEEIGEFGQETVLPSLQRQIDRLRELPAPGGDEDEVTAIYDAADEGIQTLQDGDPEDFATGGDAAFEDANRLAGEYGFQNCGGQEGAED